MTNRRKFLQASAGAAAVSLPLMWPAGAFAQQWNNQPEKGAKLRVLRWKRFVQGDEDAYMANVKKFSDKYGIPVYLDATRMAENSFFIQEREEGYANKSIAEILKEFCSYTEGAWMSAKKDSLVNIGGWLAVNSKDVYDIAANWVVGPPGACSISQKEKRLMRNRTGIACRSRRTM